MIFFAAIPNVLTRKVPAVRPVAATASETEHPSRRSSARRARTGATLRVVGRLARRTVEQLHAESGFKMADGLAERGGG